MKEKNKFTHGRTSTFNIHYHIIWTTRYKEPILKGDIKKELKNILKYIALKYGFLIEKLIINESNHIHLLVSVPPKISVTKLLQYLKGESGKYLSNLFSINYSKINNRHLWAKGYFVESIGTINLQAANKYIKNQT